MDAREWVQVVTQIVTTVTALVMAFLAYQTYLKAPEQEAESEPEFASDESAQDKVDSVLVFKTSKQKTWLTVSAQGLECRVDDDRDAKGGHQWTLSRTKAQEILLSNSFRVNAGYKVNTGTFTVGPRRNWLYTKSLFPEAEYLHGVLKQLLENASS